MPHITIEQPGVPPMTVELAEETSLGRAEDNKVALVADEVSRYHAKVYLRDDQTILQDLKSLNGTYVNRQRVVQRLLADGDEIYLGSRCRVVFHDDPPEHLEKRRRESSLKIEVNKIAQDMEDVTAQMTMIGRKASSSKPSTATPSPVSRPAEVPQRMQHAFRRLNALYRVSQLIASDFDLQKRLEDLLDLAIQEMSADRGFVMMRDETTDVLRVQVAREMGQELKASSPSMGIAHRAAIHGEPVLMSGSESDTKFGNRESIIRQRITAAMCVPLQIESRILGSLYIDSRRGDITFNEEDLELFQAMANQSVLAIENVKLYERMVQTEKKRANLSRFLSPGIVDMLMSETNEVQLGGQKRHVTILFADIRGFTPLSEGLAPDKLVDLLNEHFSAMTEILFKYKGTLDKYIGDSVMALFGAPFTGENDALMAVSAGLEMQKCNKALNVERVNRGLPTFELGVGINSGDVFTGYIGSPKRMDFTVIGDHVNIASRLCSVAAGGKVIVGEPTYAVVRDVVEVRSAGTPVLKGKSEQINAYEVIGMKEVTPATTIS
jgi:adenylate cyclase